MLFTATGVDEDCGSGGARTELRLVDSEASAVVDAYVARPRSAEQLLGVLKRGRQRRATAATDINGGSSRSHAVCRVELENGGSLTLVDCAGNFGVSLEES